MANKVQYGLKNVYYATVTVGTNTVTYGSPVAWPGAVSLSLSAEGDTNDFYADNIKYFTAITRPRIRAKKVSSRVLPIPSTY